MHTNTLQSNTTVYMYARGQTSAIRSSLRPKLAQYKKTMGMLKNDLSRVQRSAILGGSGGRNGGETTHHARMRDALGGMQTQTDKLAQAQRTALETEEVALGIMGNLAENRETIRSARNKARNTIGLTQQAKHIVRSMAQREKQRKCMMCCFAMVLIGIIILIIYLSSSGKSDSGSGSESNSGSGGRLLSMRGAADILQLIHHN